MSTPRRIGLGAAAGPRLVTWAADGESVRVTGTDGRVLGTEATEFADFVVLPAQSDGAYRVRGENAALAVYELTDQAPPGVTVDGITFRDRVASQRLVAADIGKPGDRELTFDFEVPAGYLTGSVLCTGGGPGTRVNLAFGDQGGVSSSGCQESTFDPGGQGGFGFTSGVGTPPGQTTSVRVWVTSDARGGHSRGSSPRGRPVRRRPAGRGLSGLRGDPGSAGVRRPHLAIRRPGGRPAGIARAGCPGPGGDARLLLLRAPGPGDRPHGARR